jgi:cell division transport system ATP-binding protein
MIQFSHVYKTYQGPVHALRDVQLDIQKGEFVFLTGPSGAGKTTMFRLITGFDVPTSGQVKIGSTYINELTSSTLPAFRRQIGVVFQDFKLLRDRTVFENIIMPLELRRERSHVARQKVQEMLEKVGLTFKKDCFPAQLSGGEQQRVAIARALVHQPGVLIADEPTGNLDPELSEEIMDLFERVNSQGTTVFLATHDHDMVKRRNKRVIQISEGKVLSSESL